MSRRGIFSFGTSRTERKASLLLFLIGLGSFTQVNVGGYTAISELILVASLPFTLLKNSRMFSHDRCLLVLWLLILWGVGQLGVDLFLGNYFAALIRGLIPPVGILAALLVVYPLLRKNPDALKWILLGSALSGVISIFVFQRGCDIGGESVLSGQQTATEAIVGYKLFWVVKLNEWLGMPIKGWYLQTPRWFVIGMSSFLALFGLYSGGRSAFLVGMISALFLFIAGKTVRELRIIKKNLIFIFIGLALLMPVVRYAYKEAATSGWMGERELAKYEDQAKGRGALDILIAGRGEFFICIQACLDKPIIGHGSYALDTKGYVRNFFVKYGADEETLKRIDKAVMMNGGMQLIPRHSHIAGAWLWGGVLGLLPWIYVLFLFGKTLLRRLDVYPPYVGYFAMVLPGMFWAIFFSPLGSRINMAVTIATCLVVQTMERQRCVIMPSVKAW